MKKFTFILITLLAILALVFSTSYTQLDYKKNKILSELNNIDNYLDELLIIKSAPLMNAQEKVEINNYYPYFVKYHNYYYYYNVDNPEVFGIGAMISPYTERSLFEPSEFEFVVEIFENPAHYSFFTIDSSIDETIYIYEQLSFNHKNISYLVTSIRKSDDSMEVSQEKLLNYLTHNLVPMKDI